MKKINIDLDKYMVYKNAEGDLFAAVDIKQHSTMDSYYRRYNKFKTAPKDVTIEGYMIVPDQEPNVYKIDTSRKIDFPVSELRRTTWIIKGR